MGQVRPTSPNFRSTDPLIGSYHFPALLDDVPGLEEVLGGHGDVTVGRLIVDGAERGLSGSAGWVESDGEVEGPSRGAWDGQQVGSPPYGGLLSGLASQAGPTALGIARAARGAGGGGGAAGAGRGGCAGTAAAATAGALAAAGIGRMSEDGAVMRVPTTPARVAVD